MTTKFIPSLRSCFETHGYSAVASGNNNSKAEQDSSVVVVVNSTIYIIESDYSWTPEASGLYATGTGAPYALGALHVLTAGKKLSPSQAKGVLLKALQVSAKFDPYTGSPFNTYVQEVEKTK
jgi:ATP-dependent protease HslVU (ClpYQ) peptidase subunit